MANHEVPRRIDRLRHTPAERAITDAMGAVEALPAHPFLTDAVILLGQAKDKVADYVDGVQEEVEVSLVTPSPQPDVLRCPNCGSERVAPTRGNAVGNTMDCLACLTDFTPPSGKNGSRVNAANVRRHVNFLVSVIHALRDAESYTLADKLANWVNTVLNPLLDAQRTPSEAVETYEVWYPVYKGGAPDRMAAEPFTDREDALLQATVLKEGQFKDERVEIRHVRTTREVLDTEVVE